MIFFVILNGFFVIFKKLILLSSLLILGACGGGGGDDSSSDKSSVEHSDTSSTTDTISTENSPFSLALSETVNKTISEKKWHYYKLETPEDILLNISLEQLTGDVDLYVKQNEIPTKYDYDCRSNNSFNRSEKCLQRLKNGTVHYISVAAQGDASYQLKAVLDEITISKVTLLLHGLASDADTWDNLIGDDSFYAGSCLKLNFEDKIELLPQVNSQSESCFRLNFGGYDRDINVSASGLDGKTCLDSSGCNGDYTHFEYLGKEVESAIASIVKRLGIDTEIVLLGHSRGGLAARAYLQSQGAQYKEYVKALVTTGTPHQGSPLGRFYRYMEDNCIPKSSYENDNDICEDNWEVVKMLAGVRWYQDDFMIDLLVPSIDFLSPESNEINKLNENLVSLENIKISELSYQGTQFGILAKNATGLLKDGDYDLYNYRQFFGGDHPNPTTLRYIEKGASRESLIGDGIVPAYSQKLSNLLISQGRNVDKSFSSNESKVLHTEQTSKVTDLYTVFESVRSQIGWND
ncbi:MULTISPECIES: pre-peptidase C-terminal domain-containing protein [unclassified Photobacterium]|uniref:PGAP1-like alpha/beta domain-containing protein n=1 Tax=unclassified Photobacterium TaxID=2628852 RepID=UPI001EDE5D92|nr:MULTISPECIES: pre-peptidase C-terminal domain-containing protein [unclassified Photobacterium]MCG3864421.1 hypothetical protein [Photobacterium sp. Ph6]MCG3875995.1 hypothetical protein [Photobacterium sp. Ph5]